MLEFILARYNYWIVIVLMMTGLYIVFSRGNLIKTLIGLNLFQTSVFIFYITIGKVAGGTAPILIGGHGEDAGHGDAGHGPAHNDPAHGVADHGGAHTVVDSLSAEDAAAYAAGELANSASSLEDAAHGATGETVVAGLHSLPDAPSNSLFSASADESGTKLEDHGADHAESGITMEHGSEIAHNAPHSDSSASHIVDGVGDILYSNPLPHVLILTAIVVGVATTAVGLALCVRIREAYGTIDEDALEQLNNESEFGAGAAAIGGVS